MSVIGKGYGEVKYIMIIIWNCCDMFMSLYYHCKIYLDG